MAGRPLPAGKRPLRAVIFCHSLTSDWNHGNAHFLRGVASELLARGHQVRVFEPANGWSRANLLHDEGAAAIDDFHRAYPELSSTLYRLDDAGAASTVFRMGEGTGECPPGTLNHEETDASLNRLHEGETDASLKWRHEGHSDASLKRPAEAETDASLKRLAEAEADGSPKRRDDAEADGSLKRRHETADEGVPLDLEAVLDDVDLVIVHEWNGDALVKQVGEVRRRGGRFALLFFDSHHKAVTDPRAIERLDLRDYDGVLAFGRVLRDLYLERGWAARAWIFHEAADLRHFYPPGSAEQRTGGSVASSRSSGYMGRFRFPEPTEERTGLVWIGNWGDDERTSELAEFMLKPIAELGVQATAYGVRYPAEGRAALAAVGMKYAGWLPNYAAPAVYARHAVTVHVPRRPYARALPGIPTIRVFEALACGIPLVCAPWDDVEGLFAPGEDYLVARNGVEMREHLKMVLEDRAFAASMAERGLATIKARHTCAHRVDELLAVYEEVRGHAAPRGELPEGGVEAE